MENVAFIVNSIVKNKSRFYREVEHARKDFPDYEIDVHETSINYNGTAVTDTLSKKYDYIIAVGGDGTINEVANGVLKRGDFTGKIGALTYGTANDFSKTLPFPGNIKELFESISKDSYQTIDTGLIEYTDEIGNSLTRYFINIADLGMGADVVQRVNRSNKAFGSDFTFMKAIIQTFFSYKNRPVHVDGDDFKWRGKINSVVVANGKYFGSGLCIAPHASPSDGSLEIVISGDISIMDYLKNVGKIKKGRSVDHPQVFYHKSKQIKVDGEGTPCAIECDGEFLGYTPVGISISSKKLDFIKKAFSKGPSS